MFAVQSVGFRALGFTEKGRVLYRQCSGTRGFQRVVWEVW